MPQADTTQFLEPTRILRDCLDSACESIEQLIAILEDCHKKLKPYGGSTLSDREVVQNILKKLPAKNASALIAAAMGLAEFAPPDFTDDTYGPITDLREELERLQRIRYNLHAALEGLP